MSFCLALGSGPVPAPTRRWQPQCLETDNAIRAPQGVQELRAKLCAHEREVTASDAEREQEALFVRGH